MDRAASFRAMKTQLPVLGVDIGRVIIHGDGPDSSFIGGTDEASLRAPAMTGAFEAVGRLNERFDRRVWLVSKCGPRIQERTRRWLAHTRFFETTGIPPHQLRFCRERKEKSPICAELGIGLFVDDRLDVLEAMRDVVMHRFQFGATASPPGIVPVATWSAAEPAILQTLTPSG
jgi:hypothetical protein